MRHVAVVPIGGQEAALLPSDRARYRACEDGFSDRCRRPVSGLPSGCYAVRNNYLVEHASLLVAWYDGFAPRHAPYGFPSPCAGMEFVEPPTR